MKEWSLKYFFSCTVKVHNSSFISSFEWWQTFFRMSQKYFFFHFDLKTKIYKILKEMKTLRLKFYYFFFIFFIRLPPEFLPVLGLLTRWCFVHGLQPWEYTQYVVLFGTWQRFRDNPILKMNKIPCYSEIIIPRGIQILSASSWGR